MQHLYPTKTMLGELKKTSHNCSRNFVHRITVIAYKNWR